MPGCQGPGTPRSCRSCYAPGVSRSRCDVSSHVVAGHADELITTPALDVRHAPPFGLRDRGAGRSPMRGAAPRDVAEGANRNVNVLIAVNAEFNL